MVIKNRATQKLRCVSGMNEATSDSKPGMQLFHFPKATDRPFSLRTNMHDSQPPLAAVGQWLRLSTGHVLM